MSDFTFNPFIVEHISPTVIKERAANGALIIFNVENGADETISVWANAAQDELARWPQNHICLFLHDLHKTGILAFGKRMQEAFQEIYEVRPDLKRYVAVVMSAGSAAEIAELDVMVRELKAKIDYPVHWEVFNSREKALEWLLRNAS